MKNENQKKSIILIGPCGVGKSLIANELSQRTNLPILDIDDIIAFIQADASETLTISEQVQKEFITSHINELKKLDRQPLSEEETIIENKMVYDLVDLYNTYHKNLGGFEQFYQEYYNYVRVLNDNMSAQEEIYHLNKLTLAILKKIFNQTSTPFIISPPASFGFQSVENTNLNNKFLEYEINKFLKNTQTILLQPGNDYSLRNPSGDTSANKTFINNMDKYYKPIRLEISTNALFNEPENDFLQQRTWLNVREFITKNRLKNKGEINNICDQIVSQLQDLNLEK